MWGDVILVILATVVGCMNNRYFKTNASRSDEFEFHGHYCMVMPMLGCSLYDVLKENDYRSFPMSYIRPILQHVSQ